MRDQTLLYWGMVVTGFLLIAGLLTLRQLLENYLSSRHKRQRHDQESAP
ncbi:MAG TPA: hypothetical protein VFE85_00790 [Woeseiaceae bacterium]|nr:hypothetical protein [Woeseiaceae bacterium]